MIFQNIFQYLPISSGPRMSFPYCTTEKGGLNRPLRSRGTEVKRPQKERTTCLEPQLFGVGSLCCSWIPDFLRPILETDHSLIKKCYESSWARAYWVWFMLEKNNVLRNPWDCGCYSPNMNCVKFVLKLSETTNQMMAISPTFSTRKLWFLMFLLSCHGC